MFYAVQFTQYGPISKALTADTVEAAIAELQQLDWQEVYDDGSDDLDRAIEVDMTDMGEELARCALSALGYLCEHGGVDTAVRIHADGYSQDEFRIWMEGDVYEAAPEVEDGDILFKFDSVTIPLKVLFDASKGDTEDLEEIIKIWCDSGCWGGEDGEPGDIEWAWELGDLSGEVVYQYPGTSSYWENRISELLDLPDRVTVTVKIED